MKRVGLIGCGAIGRPVARALLVGKAGAHSLAAVLARARRDLDGFPVTDIADRFLAGGHDLIIEAGGPAAFRALVPIRSSSARSAASRRPLDTRCALRRVRLPRSMASRPPWPGAWRAWTSSSISAPGRRPSPSSYSREARGRSG